jgi:hypothetical protein
MLNPVLNPVMPHGARLSHSFPSLSYQSAVKWAWISWLILGIIPFLLFIWMIWTLPSNFNPQVTAGESWFVFSSIYLMVAVPASFFWRGHIFKEYWQGRRVMPGKYFFGMIEVWLALVFGGVISVTGCIVSGAIMPNLIPAILAFMFYVTLFPSGRAMTRTDGDSLDAEVYKEPR